MVKLPKPCLTIVSSWAESGEDARHSYRTGYLNAAELLTKTIEASEGFDNRLSSLIYPIINLYRHFVELTLKDFIDLAVYVGPYISDLYSFSQIACKREKLSHDLWEAYILVKLIISGLYLPPGLVQMADLCCLEVIRWLQHIDQKGDSFRYPLNRRQEAQFANSFRVDLPWLRVKIASFDNFMYEEHRFLRSFLDPDANNIDERTYKW